MFLRRLVALFRGPNEWPAPSVPFAPGDRVVWRSMVIDGRPLALAGTYVADGPAPRVTVRHDGSPSDAQVRPHELHPESDYLARAGTRAYPRPTAWS